MERAEPGVCAVLDPAEFVSVRKILEEGYAAGGETTVLATIAAQYLQMSREWSESVIQRPAGSSTDGDVDGRIDRQGDQIYRAPPSPFEIQIVRDCIHRTHLGVRVAAPPLLVDRVRHLFQEQGLPVPNPATIQKKVPQALQWLVLEVDEQIRRAVSAAWSTVAWPSEKPLLRKSSVNATFDRIAFRLLWSSREEDLVICVVDSGFVQQHAPDVNCVQLGATKTEWLGVSGAQVSNGPEIIDSINYVLQEFPARVTDVLVASPDGLKDLALLGLNRAIAGRHDLEALRNNWDGIGDNLKVHSIRECDPNFDDSELAALRQQKNTTEYRNQKRRQLIDTFINRAEPIDYQFGTVYLTPSTGVHPSSAPMLRAIEETTGVPAFRISRESRAPCRGIEIERSDVEYRPRITTDGRVIGRLDVTVRDPNLRAKFAALKRPELRSIVDGQSLTRVTKVYVRQTKDE